MKKSLLALAILGAFAGVASAQSSVTLYGTLDVNARVVSNDGSARRYSLSQDGVNSSQLGFKGVEDLGGGLKAGFVLLSGVNTDTGTTNTKFFNRRATVSLMGNFGEVRLGRDYTPSFWNNTIFDAFGTVGLGDSTGVKQVSAPGFVRADNSIGFFLPSNIGGIYGQFMAAAGEGAVPAAATGTVNGGNAPGRYLGGRIGYAAGPFDVAVSYATQRVVGLTFTAADLAQAGTVAGSSVSSLALGAGTYKSANIGGSYDLGVVKLMGYFNRETLNTATDNVYSISAVVPMGQGEIHAGYDRSKLSDTGVSNKVDKLALGYVYNLSKRTAVYTNVARLSNGNATAVTLGAVGSASGLASSNSATALPTVGGKSTGAEFGVRHFF